MPSILAICYDLHCRIFGVDVLLRLQGLTCDIGNASSDAAICCPDFIANFSLPPILDHVLLLQLSMNSLGPLTTMTAESSPR